MNTRMSQEKNISCSSSEKKELQDKQTFINNEFCEENGIADLTLIVENHKIPLCKPVLCIASPVFRTMLEGHFREKTETEIPLPGKRYDDFVEFLRCIYPDKMQKVTEKNVYMILPLAHQYNVRVMTNRCREVLMQIVKNMHTRNVEELYRHLNLAEIYSLEELKEKCIYLASEHTLKQFKAARTAYQISDASHYTIIELALRRRELDITDEKVFEVQSAKKENAFSFQHGYSHNGITCELQGRIDMEEENKDDMLRALRLIERFKITTDDKNMKSKLLNQLRTVYRNGECIEEFDLLPENVKDALQNNS